MAERIDRKRIVAGSIALAAIGCIAFFETHHRIPAFRAWSWASTSLLLAAGVVLVPVRLRSVALTIATLGFGLFVLEVAAIAIEPKPFKLVVIPSGLVQRPVVGSGFDQAMVVHSVKTTPDGRPVFDAHYTIGKTLDRVVESAKTGPATVFFGDSFTFGEGLDNADTLPQRFADLRPGERVLNLAISGWSPQQFLREVETGLHDDVIGPKPKTFVFLTSPFHAARTACKETFINNSPRYASVDGEITFQGPCYSPAAAAWREYRMNSALHRVVAQPVLSKVTHEDVELYIRILVKAVALSRERFGVETLVPFVFAKQGYLQGTGWTNESIVAALKAQGVWVVDVTLPDDPRSHLEIVGDGHPTGLANGLRAQTISDLLDKPKSSESAGLNP